MGTKDISIRQGVAVSTVDQWIDKALNRGDQVSSTVEGMLAHPQVKKHGTFGRLSSSQQNIVTSVVSVMQDQVSKDAKNNAESLKEIILLEREALKAMSNSFASTAKSLYKLPLISSVQSDSSVSYGGGKRGYAEGEGTQYQTTQSTSSHYQDDVGAVEPGDINQHWSRFISWGNMISVAAIVLLTLVVKISVETANFETQYHKSVAKVKELELLLNTKEIKYESLMGELQLAEVKVASLTTEIEGQRKNSEQQQAQQSQNIHKIEQQFIQFERLSVSTQKSLNSEIKALKE